MITCSYYVRYVSHAKVAYKFNVAADLCLEQFIFDEVVVINLEKMHKSINSF